MSTPPATALFFSGGKDGFHCRHREPGITHLLTTYDEASGRVPIQGVRIDVIRAQASAMDLRLVEVPLPAGSNNRVWSETLARVIRDHGFERLVFGDLHLEDIRAFRERLLGPTGCELRYPLWTTDTRALANEMLASGLECRICSIMPGRLPATTLGGPWDATFIETLPDNVDPCGENGEFHTVVTGGPGMQELELREAGLVSSLGYQVMDFEPG